MVLNINISADALNALNTLPGKWLLIAVFLIISLAVPVSTYLLTTLLSLKAQRGGKDGKDDKVGQEPPIVPYYIPYIGNFFSYAWDTKGFIERINHRFGSKTPFTITLGPAKGYLIQQPEDIAKLFRYGKTHTNKPYLSLLMCQIFGTPKNMYHIYRNDNSGVGSVPLPGSAVPSHLRVWSHQHSTAERFLNGENLRLLGGRFMDVLHRTLGQANSADPADSGEWVELPDFYQWWRDRVFHAVVEAVFGPHLMRLSPDIGDDFWAYHAGLPKLVKFYPRWLFPGPYAARDRVVAGIKKWHTYARQHSDPQVSAPGEAFEDGYWGSQWIKGRQRWGQDTKLLDDDALAAEDFALLLAAASNAIPMAFWYLIHIYSAPELMRRVQDELDIAFSPSSSAAILTETETAQQSQRQRRFNLDTLTSSPLLQSVYAETLRLYVSFLLSRTADGPTNREIRLGRWNLRSNGFIAMSTSSAGRMADGWGPERTDSGRQPLDHFWAERFLVPCGDPLDSKSRSPHATTGTPPEKAANMKFSVDKLTGAWIPFGGGILTCPGRHLAKQEIIGSAAIFSCYYELEALTGVPPVDDYFYGMGAQPPAGSCRVRIRRKVRP